MGLIDTSLYPPSPKKKWYTKVCGFNVKLNGNQTEHVHILIFVAKYENVPILLLIFCLASPQEKINQWQRGKTRSEIWNNLQNSKFLKKFLLASIKSTKAQRRKAGTENSDATFGHSSESVRVFKEARKYFRFFPS